MGSIVKITMPLLSTLAALVIIVHTAEENYDRNYREIRRALDVEPPNYDQSWRAVDVQPVITQSIPQNQEGWNDDSPDQPMRRRRRKRKRRPQFPIQDEEQSPDTYVLKNEPQAIQEDNIEMTVRRRKKVNDQEKEEYNRPGYRSGQSPNKPLRRRGQRRRRPLVVETWPELSEFNRHRQDQSDNEERNEEYKSRNDNIYNIPNINNEKGVDVTPEDQPTYSNEQYFEEKPFLANANDDKTHPDGIPPKDRSLSEFSSELVQPAQSSNSPIINTANKIKDKTISISNEINKPQEPLDPRSLKALLKRSNGKSLSEILQQNNLSLSDLLNGKAKALSILQTGDEADIKDSNQLKLEDHLSTTMAPLEDIPIMVSEEHIKKEDGEISDCDTTELNMNDKHNASEVMNLHEKQIDVDNSTRNENTSKGYIRHRFPMGTRRRLRLRPKTNSTSQRQNNRDIINLTSIKYKNSRHINKSKEWKEVVSSMMKRRPSSTETIKLESMTDDVRITTTASTLEETTTEEIYETTTDLSALSMNTEVIFYGDNDNMEGDNTASSSKSYVISEISSPAVEIVDKETITEKVPKLSPLLRPLVNSSELRRQAYSNRLKRKRLKQKEVTIGEHDLKNVFSTANFVAASEFIEKVQTKATAAETESYTTLEDFMTTEPAATTVASRSTKAKNSRKTTRVLRPTTQSIPIPTQDSAKYEIDEILNDSITSARLSKILKERNMTLSELVEHRERGSSQVHLADIFHNASKEPNPPEPFLSKSLIEPISREIYPLRALLEANLHDPKTTTIDTNSVSTNNLNIPVVMDFGNNVNENGENMGIITLFNNFSKLNNEMNVQDNNIKDETEIPNDNNEEKMATAREGRNLSAEKDAITWNDLITLMQSHHQNEHEAKVETDNSPIYENLKNIKLDEDINENGLIVLDDLQNLKNFDTLPTSDELLEIKLYENSEFSTQNSIDSSFNTTTKSVTVATVTIIGLALILFLFTYGILKWKQQSKVYHNKHSREEEYVPSPVFENRKGQKINSSTRSKSPMLSSNIYAIDSLDTHGGNESPEYMWDSLRKPFQ